MQNYMNDYQTMITDLNAASLATNQILIGPSTCCNWNETDLFNLGNILSAQVSAWKLIRDISISRIFEHLFGKPENGCGSKISDW